MSSKIFLWLCIVIYYQANPLAFPLKYESFEKFLTQKTSLDQIQATLSPTYKVGLKEEYNCTFKCDTCSSWIVNVVVGIQFKEIRSIQFVVKKTLINEYEAQLRNLGYTDVKNYFPERILFRVENKAKKLGAEIRDIGDTRPGMVICSIYKL